MTIREYISDRLGVTVFMAAFVMAAAGFLGATGTGGGVILLLLIFCLLIFAGIHAAGFFRCRARLRELESILEGLDEKYLFAQCIPAGGSIYERRVLELFRKAGRAMIGTVSDARETQREYREYVESWVHEIKTPITAAGLISRRMDPVTRRKLSAELAQIESHVERALFYARAENPEKDFIIRQAAISEIVEEAVERHRTLLIQSGVRVETEDSEDGGEGLEQIVYTDVKWAVFILGQLLQNAARYRRDACEEAASGEKTPVIALKAGRLGKQLQLTVSDNGMGIPAHELSRVFDRGFTGSNGRSRGGSTGMGLYLCRKLAACLEIELRIASMAGEGTTVTLIFPARGQ